MGKMAEDIIALRTQVVALESDNSQLRSDLSLHHDLARDLLKDTDVDVMTKAEMADRIGISGAPFSATDHTTPPKPWVLHHDHEHPC